MSSFSTAKKSANMMLMPSHPSHSLSSNESFFRARCTVRKSDVSCPGLDYFPLRFLHVLLLRLVFRFTIEQHQDTSASPDNNDYLLKRGGTINVELWCPCTRTDEWGGSSHITYSKESAKKNCILSYHQLCNEGQARVLPLIRSVFPHNYNYATPFPITYYAMSLPELCNQLVSGLRRVCR